MTSRELRTQRRAAERQQRKNDRKAQAQQPVESAPAAAPSAAANQPTEAPATDRAAINRANAQHSTGPQTLEGKKRSAQNALKHGFYSMKVLQTGDDPAEFMRLCLALHAEHQPTTPTETALVEEIANNIWRLRRFHAWEAQSVDPGNPEAALDDKRLALLLRFTQSAERGLHKAITTLTQLQKIRGFVPQKVHFTEPAQIETAEKVEPRSQPLSKTHQSAPVPNGFVPSNPQFALAKDENRRSNHIETHSESGAHKPFASSEPGEKVQSAR